MIKLAEEKCYSDIITHEQFQSLALLMIVSLFFFLGSFSLIDHIYMYVGFFQAYNT